MTGIGCFSYRRESERQRHSATEKTVAKATDPSLPHCGESVNINFRQASAEHTYFQQVYTLLSPSSLLTNSSEYSVHN